MGEHLKAKSDLNGTNGTAPSERRRHERLPASDVKGLSLHLGPGQPVTLQDISRSGARFQGEARLLPGLSVALRLVTPDGTLTVRSRIVRSRLVRMEKGHTVYEAAVEFAELLPGVALQEPSAPKSEAPARRVTTEPVPAIAVTLPLPRVADDLSPTQKRAAADDLFDTDDVPLMLLTAAVNRPIVELHEMFNGNEW